MIYVVLIVGLVAVVLLSYYGSLAMLKGLGNLRLRVQERTSQLKESLSSSGGAPITIRRSHDDDSEEDDEEDDLGEVWVEEDDDNYLDEDEEDEDEENEDEENEDEEDEDEEDEDEDDLEEDEDEENEDEEDEDEEDDEDPDENHTRSPLSTEQEELRRAQETIHREMQRVGEEMRRAMQTIARFGNTSFVERRVTRVSPRTQTPDRRKSPAKNTAKPAALEKPSKPRKSWFERLLQDKN
jgi:hypothetical protein